MSSIDVDVEVRKATAFEEYQHARLEPKRKRLRAFLKSNGDLKQLAADMIVCEATLLRLLDGTTRRPSDWTLWRLDMCLDAWEGKLHKPESRS